MTESELKHTLANLRALEEALSAYARSVPVSAKDLARVKSQLGADGAALVLEAATLQTMAIKKLGEGLWWVTRRSLQQATPRAVADLKASWFRAANMVDLCCGIGSDSVSLARQNPGSELRLCDLDPMVAAMAGENVRRNVEHQDQVNCFVSIEDAACFDASPEALIHIDPDRRDGSRRTTREDQFSPPLSSLLPAIKRVRGALVKLAPATQLDAFDFGHRIWISLQGSVREQSWLCGQVIERASAQLQRPLAEKGRSAVKVLSDGKHFVFSPEKWVECCETVSRPMRYLIDPDAAIRAAGLTETFAVENELSAVGAASGFLTGQTAVDGRLAACEEVLWTGSNDERKLRKTLRDNDWFPIRVKARGATSDPNALEKRFRNCGETPVSLWIGRVGKKQYAAVTRA